MSNGEVCCILGVCCPPGSPEQAAALQAFVQAQRPGLSASAVARITDRLLVHHHHFRTVGELLDAPVE